MHNTSINLKSNNWCLPTYHTILSSLKSCALISSLGMGMIGSAFLTYRNPQYSLLMSCSVGIFNAYLLPYCLRYGNLKMAKWALITNLTVQSSLSLGFLSIGSIALSQALVIFLKNYQVASTVKCLNLLTMIVGIAVPVFIIALKRGFRLFNHAKQTHTRIAYLHHHFRSNSIKSPFSIMSIIQQIWQNFILQLALFIPKLTLSLYGIFSIHPSDNLWAMLAVSADRVDLVHLREKISGMEQTVHLAQLQGSLIPREMQQNHVINLKMILLSLEPKDLPEAISLLLQHGLKIIPQVLSTAQFLEFFKEQSIRDTTNTMIQQFLDQVICWDSLYLDYQQLNMDMVQLEQEIMNVNLQQLTPIQTENFLYRQNKIQERFSTIRSSIENLYFQKRTWSTCISFWDTEERLPFEQDGSLLLILNDSTLWQQIEDAYRSLIGGGGQQPGLNLCRSLQYINDKLQTLKNGEEDSGEEDSSATFFLAASGGFVQKDYVDMQNLLNVDSLHDVEKAMETIGLKTEEDLYKNKILSKTSELSKEEIRTQLFQYIKKALKTQKLPNSVISKNKISLKSIFSNLIEKVTRTFFYVISSACVLVPVLIHPKSAKIGFILGTTYFAVKRLGFSIPSLPNFVNRIGLRTRNLLSLDRPTFFINSQGREVANEFVKADFFKRIQMIYAKTLHALMISYADCRVSTQYGIGGFLRGLSLANEVVNIF